MKERCVTTLITAAKETRGGGANQKTFHGVVGIFLELPVHVHKPE